MCEKAVHVCACLGIKCLWKDVGNTLSAMAAVGEAVGGTQRSLPAHCTGQCVKFSPLVLL